MDGAGTFASQRTLPELARVTTAIEGDALRLDAPGMPPLRVPLELPGGARRDVVVWKSTCAALSAGPEAAGWLGAYLGAPHELVYMPDSTERAVDADYGRAGDVVSFADAFPVLIASTSSLDDLNAKLGSPVPMNRFRPSVVVRGAPAWDEDTWRVVAVGGATMRVVKTCGRCTVITVDQDTGQRGAEPLRTLATFRTQQGSVNFAVNAIPDGELTLRVGDAIEIVERGAA